MKRRKRCLDDSQSSDAIRRQLYFQSFDSRNITSLLHMEHINSALGIFSTSRPGNSSAQDVGDKYEIPAPQDFTSFEALKDRIRHHYELCSDYYYSLW